MNEQNVFVMLSNWFHESTIFHMAIRQLLVNLCIYQKSHYLQNSMFKQHNCFVCINMRIWALIILNCLRVAVRKTTNFIKNNDKAFEGDLKCFLSRQGGRWRDFYFYFSMKFPLQTVGRGVCFEVCKIVICSGNDLFTWSKSLSGQL